MKHKKYLIALLLAFIIGVNAYVFLNYLHKKSTAQQVFSAISERTSFFLYTQNLDSALARLDSVSYLPTLQTSRVFDAMHKHIKQSNGLLDTLCTTTKYKYTNTAFTANHIGSDQLGFLSLIQFDQNIKTAKVKQLFAAKKYQTKSYKYQKFKIVTARSPKGEELSFATNNNLLLISKSTPLLEESLNALSTGKNKAANPSFQSLKENVKKPADWHLFVDNTQKDIHSILYNSKFKLTQYAQETIWQHYAFNVEPKEIKLALSFPEKKDAPSLNKLLKGEATPFTLDSILPNSTAYFEAYHSKNNVLFQQNDASYAFFKEWLDQEAAFFCLETFDEDYSKRAGLVLKTKNIDTAKVNLYLLNKEMAPVDNYEGNAIYEMNVDVLSTFFKSNWFYLKKPYFAFINQYIVFSDEKSVLRTCIQKAKAKKTLAYESNIHFSNEPLSKKIVYLNPQRCQPVLNQVFNPTIFPAPLGALQLNYFADNSKIWAKGQWRMDAEKVNKTALLWTAVLDTFSSFEPQLVINADNKRKEIISQDANNTIYLINQSGQILLKKPFDEKIESEVYQIDLYKANKLFYVFNTEKHIYALKRNGKLVDGYPIKLPGKASNSLLVVNYDKSKKYRFFIACENQKLYGYEANGTPLSGWSPLALEVGLVEHPLAYTVFNGKDYIYFHNAAGSFFAVNRKGNLRHPVVNLETPFTQQFEVTKNSFVNVSKGSSYTINLKGKTTVKIVADTSYNHFANYATKKAYALGNENTFVVATNKWNTLGKKRLNDSILSIEKVILNDKNLFLVNCKRSIYILNELGEIQRDFPMFSSSSARITNFYSNKHETLLFQEGNTLNAYELIVTD